MPKHNAKAAGLSPDSVALMDQLTHFADTPGRRELLVQALRARDLAAAARDARLGELTLVTGRSGVSHAHPLLKIEVESQKLFLKFALALGLRATAGQIEMDELVERKK